jgi:hypothetical protein
MPLMCCEEAIQGADPLCSGTHQMPTLWDLETEKTEQTVDKNDRN